MGIIGDAERKKRVSYIDSELAAKEKRKSDAFASLQDLLPSIVNDLKANARDWHEKRGNVTAAVAYIPGSLYVLKGNDCAQQLILNAMLEIENKTSSVEIGDEDYCSHYDDERRIKVVAHFSPPLT